MTTKFWTIGSTGNYSPSANPLVAFGGNVGTTGITGVDSSVITAIQALGATSVAIQIGALGAIKPTFDAAPIGIASATGGVITFTSTYVGSGTGPSNSIYYYSAKKPAVFKDGPIVAILGITGSSDAFSFTDANGNAVTIPAGAIKQGTVYNFAINNVTAVTSGHVLGLSEF